ncbi:MAG: hypothetical protein V5A55_13470 [Halovenus sp.]
MGAKTYYPETTIWLKSGVTLEGLRRTRQVDTIKRDPDVDGFPRPKRSTVISTRDLNEGAGAYTHEHDADDPHPHFPVVANHHMPTIENGEVVTRDATDQELDLWGVDVSLQNVVLDATESQRWWDYDAHGADDVYNAGKNIDGVDMSARDWSTYFGVYDALLFERTMDVFTKNIETRGFLGYGGFWQHARNSVDIGGLYRGGATDYHGSAYTLDVDHARDAATYTTGTWDFSAEGPMPTAEFAGHVGNKFMSVQSVPRNTTPGSPGGNHIRGMGTQFLGDETRFRTGDAPLSDPYWADAVVAEKDQSTEMEGFTIATGGNEYSGIGFKSRDPQTTLHNVSVRGCEIGIDMAGNRSAVRDCDISSCRTGMRCHNIQAEVDALRIRDCEYGFIFSRANPSAPLNGVNLQGVGTFIQSGHNKRTRFNYPHFANVDSFGDDFAGLTLTHPWGYEDVDDFPERHEPA